MVKDIRWVPKLTKAKLKNKRSNLKKHSLKKLISGSTFTARADWHYFCQKATTFCNFIVTFRYGRLCFLRLFIYSCYERFLQPSSHEQFQSLRINNSSLMLSTDWRSLWTVTNAIQCHAGNHEDCKLIDSVKISCKPYFITLTVLSQFCDFRTTRQVQSFQYWTDLPWSWASGDCCVLKSSITISTTVVQ